MNELQLGLVGAGAAIVIGVVVYNGLQGRRARRRLPRTMPDGPAEVPPIAPLDAHEEHPFIHPTTAPRREPVSAPVAARAPAAAAPSTAGAPTAPVGASTSAGAPAGASAAGPNGVAAAAKAAPGDAVSGDGALPLAGDARREPTFGGVNDLIAPADVPAGAAAAEWAAGAEPPLDAEPRPGGTQTPTPPAGDMTTVRDGVASSADVISSRRIVTATAPLDARVATSQAGAAEGASSAAANIAATSAATPAAGAAATDIADTTTRAGGVDTGMAAAAPDTDRATSGASVTGMTETAGASAAGTGAAVAGGDAPGEAGQRREPVLGPVEPEPQSPATTVSNLPPVVVDRRIDCIIELEPGEVVSGERIIPLAIRFRRAGSKPVYVEGRDQNGHWGTLRPGNEYGKLRAAVQLANRSGPLNELEFSEFVGGVHRLADALDAAAEFPDMTEVVQMARELDGFAAQCDAQLSVNVLSDSAPWSGSYVQAVASQDGLLLSRDGTRFVKLDAQQNPVFTLTFEGTNFLRDDLTYKGGHMITLLLDVPVADEDILPWRLMCDYARSLAQRIGARVVDDQRRVLPDASLQAIDERLMTLYARLETASIPAGSPAARRLFSS